MNLPVKPLLTRTNVTAGVAAFKLEHSDQHKQVLGIFRAYIADLCQQFNGGHPGSAMGMAAIGVALYKYVMKFFPKKADYFNLNRFLLSNDKPPFSRIFSLLAFANLH